MAQLLRDGQADATVVSGDDRNLTVENHICPRIREIVFRFVAARKLVHPCVSVN
jgi:hypothetical protein